ncbi:hypothetical protein ZWY2020_046535 [Hordeum vulgare]|nr:hypothetical protein ZWY2020_046535 [Hordeum vulgare]
MGAAGAGTIKPSAVADLPVTTKNHLGHHRRHHVAPTASIPSSPCSPPPTTTSSRPAPSASAPSSTSTTSPATPSRPADDKQRDGGADGQMQDESRDNRSLDDNYTAQTLSSEDIQAIKREGASGNAIMEALIGNSSIFGNKTVFSQDAIEERESSAVDMVARFLMKTVSQVATGNQPVGTVAYIGNIHHLMQCKSAVNTGFYEFSPDVLEAAVAHVQLIIVAKFIEKMQEDIPGPGVKEKLQKLCSIYSVHLVHKHLAGERATAHFDVDAMNVAWAGSRHAVEVADRIARIIASDPN